MQERGVDFLEEDLDVAVGIIPDIFQPESDAGCGGFRRALIKISERVRFDAGGDILFIRTGFQKNRCGIHTLAELSRQSREGGMNLRLGKL